MNDEILEKWKEKTKGLFHLVEYTRFWNYITNLQKENEELKKQLEYLRTDEYLNQVKWERNFNETMNKELKTRIEKAVEYLEKNEISCYHTENGKIMNVSQDLLNILNGRSDE